MIFNYLFDKIGIVHLLIINNKRKNRVPLWLEANMYIIVS